jgi:regulatory protein|tara:strand:- start:861 stop:1322 length:462 start_codon:yes stop_codon:yes gene_type:complete
MSNNQIDDINNSIYRYLNMREHSKQELLEKLLRKNFDLKTIHECLNEFSKKDLQSDVRFTESYARVKFNSKKGPVFIRASLQIKGVSKDIIDNALSIYSDDDWEKNAKLALNKKYSIDKNNANLPTVKLRLFLQNRGFPFKIIEKAVSDYLKI